MIGETISHYRITEQIGEGAMGVVYKAEDTTLGRPVAMKFLSSTTRDYRARFLREARAVSALSHPNIATVFDCGETPEGQPYIVMELIKGQPLSEKLLEGSLPLTEAVRVVSDIAEALSEAHQQGIVHRDIKPSNVVITERGRAKVLDFGLVKQIEGQPSYADASQGTLPATHTQSNVIVGTPLYLSPEQATGRKVDARSDLFSLGVVLYECLTGQSAFSGASLIEIGAQVLNTTPPVPSRLNDRVPPELDRITMKAIEKKVEDRYQSAEELIEDLRSVLPTLREDDYRRGRTTETLPRPRTHSASALQTLAESLRRPRLSVVNATLVILVLVLGTFGILYLLRPKPYQPSEAALRLYTLGTDALRNGAFLRASKAFQQAIASDPKFPLSHARLGEAWFELDYSDRAKDEMLIVQSLVPNRSQLAQVDALHLEAINATISRDLPGAIKAYQELARISPDDPQVYVDLGRAYERNDEIKKAIESYVEATNRAPQSATAFLRVAILYGRQLDLASATAAFDKAEKLYQALDDFEGQAEVSFQRGFVLNQMSKLPEARQHLQRARDLARMMANDYGQVKALQKLGDVEILANNVPEGRRLMLEAIELAQAKSIDNLTKRGLVDLGNTFLANGEYPEAENYFKQSLDLARKQKDNRNAARALLALGSLADRKANTDGVVSYVEQALPFYQQGGYLKETLQAYALLARAKLQKGDYDAALNTFAEQLKLSERYGDSAAAGLAHQYIGFAHMGKGEYPQALKRFEQNHEIAKSLGTLKNVALSLVDRANTLGRLGRYDEARAALNEASELAERPDAATNLAAAYYLAIARLALSERKFPKARAKSQQALTLAGAQLRRTAITANSINCLSLSGSTGQAKCEEALKLARELGDPTYTSEALLMLATSQIQNNDAVAALKTALEAQELFARAGNSDGEWISLLIAARASHATGNAEKMHDYSTRAAEVRGRISQKWGADNYNTYLNRPDIQAFQSQLNQLLAQKQ